MSDERIALVTGASSGIGLETARGLGRRGFRVLIVGRNPGRTDRARDSLRDEGLAVEALRCDFSALSQVRTLAEDLSALPHLDVLVNNAGLWHQERRLSEEGFEDTFAVNHLAAFLLTNLLTPQLLMRGGRVVHVSSRLHLTAGRKRGRLWPVEHALELAGLRKRPTDARLDLEGLVAQGKFNGLDAYARSKLAQIVYSNELARRLEGTGVTSNSVHPGEVQTNVTRDSRLLSLGIRIAGMALKTPEEGAATSVWAATDPSLDGVSGKYFADCAEATPAHVVHDRSVGRRLWEVSMEMTALEPDELPDELRG